MAEIKKLSEDQFSDITSGLGFSRPLMSKDYFVTVILYLLKDIEGIYFKGGMLYRNAF